jgi:hypothetical protein
MPTVFTSGPPPNEFLVTLAACAPYTWLGSVVAGTATACCNPKRRARVVVLIILTVVMASPAMVVCGIHTLGVLRNAGSFDVSFLMNVGLPSIPLLLAAVGVWRMVRHTHENAA